MASGSDKDLTMSLTSCLSGADTESDDAAHGGSGSDDDFVLIDW